MMTAMCGRTSRQHRLTVLVAVLAVLAGMQFILTPAALAQGYVPVSGSGSTWSSNALDQWRRNVNNLFGITVNYAANGSISGRSDFRTGLVDFAVSEVPYDFTDAPQRAFGYMPTVAGGLSFMYNLKIDNSRVTNLRLPGDTIAKIFTQQITKWDDPAIKADNPGLTLPNRQIMPVVRSDGAGTTAQFTAWLASQYGGLWDDYCHQAGRNITPCGSTSFYPTIGNMQAKAGSQGVAGFVAQDSSEGTITYVEYSYARNAGFPVAKMLNQAGYYIEPKAANVSLALLNARIQPDLTQDLSQVYVNPDPRAYPLSSYAYMIIPKDTTANFNSGKGRALSDFAYYFLCGGQQQADALGYAPLPINLVQAGLDQVGQIPGSTNKLNRNNLSGCTNPTFSPDGTDLLTRNVPQPPECDRKGSTQCGPGTDGPSVPIPTITLTTSPDSQVAAGTPVTLTATAPPGFVQFKDGATDIGNPVSVTNNLALTITTLTPGTHFLTAAFTPADPTVVAPSTSNTVTFVVNAPTGATATNTTVKVFPKRAFDGLPLIFLANVAPFGATGTVQFMDGATALGAPVPVTTGFALLIDSLPEGTHTLTAVFTPTDPATHAPSTSSPVPLTVNPFFGVR
jgi:phosphate ABC transporter phosphate-binding protein